MGIGASVNADRENCEQFGDRVEVTKQLPVESFGRDNTESQGAKNGCCQTGEKTLSCGSISEERFRERVTSKTSKSRKSLGSFLGLNNRLKGDEAERTNSDGTSYSAEAAELKIKRLTKKNSELQQEKERLKRELESFRKSSTRWQMESQQAKQYEEQAKERAKVFEDELEKLRKQSKFSNDEKEKEINLLIKKIQVLKGSLAPGTTTDDEEENSYSLPEKASFESDTDVENLSLFTASGTIVDEKVPDFNTVFPLMAQVMTNSKPPNKNQTFRFFLCADKEAERDATFFMKVLIPQLRQLCLENGKFFVMLESFEADGESDERANRWESYLMSKCDIFFGMTGNRDNRFILEKWKSCYDVFNTRRRPMFFCFKDAKHNAYGGTEVAHFLDGINEEAKVCFYSHPTSLVEENNEVIQEIVKEHFGLPGEVKEQMTLDISDEELISDCESSLKQLDILRTLTMSTDSEVGFAKYYKTLDAYVNGVGPDSPLLVTGAPGSGKTTLLAKWITRQLASGDNVVLYNFVGSTTSDVFTNPAHVMRRITSQLLGIFPCLCPMLHCDPVKCEDYFLRLLKSVPAKIGRNIVIVIDAVDKLQNAGSTHLSWLNELLPDTVRVILSVTAGNEPSHWRSWTTANVSPLTIEESREILVSSWKHPDIKLHNHEATELLNDITESAVTSPLFVTMLLHELSSASNVTTSVQDYSSLQSVIELTVSILKSLQDSKGSLIDQVLALICSSRIGLAEAELMDILSLQWSEWEPLMKCLVYDRQILREVNDSLVISHEQILKAIYIHLNGDDILRQSRERLVKFYTDKLKKNGVSSSVVDQLPWLLVQQDDKENLARLISRTDVFHIFIKRSLFSDLLGYWKYLDVDSVAFGKIYMDVIRKQEGDTPCLETALRYEFLGRFLKGIDVFSLAMKCLEGALEMKEMVLEADDPWVGQSLHHLADLYVLLGNLESAEMSYKQTLEIIENSFGKDHPLVAKELECLAYVKKKLNKEKACTELQRKAARIRRKFAFPKLSSLSTSSNSLDCKLIQVNKLGAGRKTLETASSLHNVGVLLLVEKRYEDAETLLKKSLAMRESLLGANDLIVCQSLDRLATLYHDQKMYAEAIAYHKKSLDIKREKLEKGDPNLISTMNRLAIAFRKNGDIECCESTYKEVLMVLKDKLGSKDPTIATALHNLAVVNSDQNKLNEALKLFEQALGIYEERLGESHPKVAETLRNIAKVHLDLGNADVASSYLLRSQIFHDDSTMTTSSSLNSYGSANWTNSSTLDLQDG